MPSENKVYKQAPIEPISKERFDEMVSKIKKIDFIETKCDVLPVNYGCEGNKCIVNDY